MVFVNGGDKCVSSGKCQRVVRPGHEGVYVVEYEGESVGGDDDGD